MQYHARGYPGVDSIDPLLEGACGHQIVAENS